ncbi:N-acetyl-beta-glucosaminyl-glycoprotein 4-beta-N-acetylgalactosaminyltransferase 1-like isoform X4 [Hippocampus zosterae]|uniref:N-acetyl-beta-glucosaminyl-glycoprotein 4-beta-N-acetylgalactosaminyltransferase 1-like isoform X4 n=1 Tax=Hippocampus zosterae TaxID=109293 RepID=UPI00223E87D7|nr:N-acetyl-beta-glucosaminyl-glycoprotein 4-beta-N-acetylgalactosaminyltransferase 1-like isoform X4 [Hippocampus zosterae]
MITTFFPVKKLRRKGKCVLFGAILVIAAVTVVSKARWGEGTDDHGGWGSATFDQRVGVGHALEDSGFMPQAWKPEYKGRANLHVFEDWCGSSTDRLRRNLHYPLYPHSRTTVHKLAVSPQWTNYGLRIFGYLHPYTDGEFVFSLSSDDNSEFWLSTDESPSNLRLLAWVGKTGSEWTAPGEFEKYASQISKATQLSAHRRYFFEVIHKQNDKGTDHVEVAWKLLDEDSRFMVIESKYISLYANESALLMNDVAHIPQTAASHRDSVKRDAATIDLLWEDPRDALHQVPLIDDSFLQGILPSCEYKPSYTIKDYPLTRYQGLQFVHMSYVYPNDYTRLTHMEGADSCFYPEKPNHMKTFGFSRYMRLDRPDELEKKNTASDYGFKKRKSILEEDNEFGQYTYLGLMEEAEAAKHRHHPSDYGDDYDYYSLKRRRKHFSLPLNDSNHSLKKSPYGSRDKAEMDRGVVRQQTKVAEMAHLVATQSSQRHKRPAVKPEGPVKIAPNVKPKQKSAKGPNLKTVEKPQQLEPLLSRKKLAPKHIHSKRVDIKMKKAQKNKKSLQPTDAPKPAPIQDHNKEERRRDSRWSDTLWGAGGDEDLSPAPVLDADVDWSQTFQVLHVDLQAMRPDWINLRCNISGNLLLRSSDALPVVTAFMAQLNKNHGDLFKLVRVVNVEKHLDGTQGSRYLLELELKDAQGQPLRLSHYIYTPIRRHTRSQDLDSQRSKPQLVLCNPIGFRWNPVAMIHFIVPVRNQARWVQRLIDDMAGLFKATGDTNFNLIIVDYNSTDMDVRAALKKSSLHRYQYVKLSGNFERSAGLQAGVNLIDDDHSIVFLCDLHIHFPPSIMDSIRKHCVEGFMAFAPVLMRLDCGATPLEGRGYWEVHGFGLLGIYKSDLDAVGGMNTKEFTDRWGGEDWELLDRILQAGLEVERIHLRNFFHHYHSKRGMWNHRMSSGPS